MLQSQFWQTPVITVNDNRRIAVRTLNWNRSEPDKPLSLLAVAC